MSPADSVFIPRWDPKFQTMKTDNRSRAQIVVTGNRFGGLTFCAAFVDPHAQVTT